MLEPLDVFIDTSFLGQMMIAMACGLQNSMVATYHGTVIRTTHLTGITSDLGATVGNWLVGRRVSLRKIILHSSLWWGFLWAVFQLYFYTVTSDIYR